MASLAPGPIKLVRSALPAVRPPAGGLNDIEIELAEDGHGPALRLRQAAAAETAAPPDTPERRILQALAETDAPLSQRQIRKRAATRPATVASTLQGLVRQGRVKHATRGGYRIAGDGGGTTRRPGPLPETVTDPNP